MEIHTFASVIRHKFSMSIPPLFIKWCSALADNDTKTMTTQHYLYDFAPQNNA